MKKKSSKRRKRRYLVTGASRGIGRAVAEALLKEGHTVALLARNEKLLAKVAKPFGKNAFVAPIDLAEVPRIASSVRQAVAAIGGVDGLIQAAGVIHYAPVGKITQEDFESQFRVDLLAPVLVAQEVAKQMMKNPEGGSIVNLSSTLGIKPAPETLVYSAMKAALISATQTLATELAPYNIRVNAVAPGVVDTDMVRTQRRPGESVESIIKMLTALHPLGRIGRPPEIADLILYLLRAEWVTGSTFVIDGGNLVNGSI